MKSRLAKASFLSLLVASLALPASAQWGAGTGLFTENGIEVSVDARVFAVFAMLNANGYDKDIEGPAPLYRPQHAEARTSTRRRMGRPGSAVRAFGTEVEKNPGSPSAYVEAALGLSPAPKFTAGKDASKITKAIAKHTASWFNEEGGAAIYRKEADGLKAEQKKLLKPVQTLAAAIGKTVRVAANEEDILASDEAGPSGRVVIVLNELDAHDRLDRVRVGETFYVVAGPRVPGKGADDLVVHAAALAYARTLVQADADKQDKAPLVGQVWGWLDKAGKAAVGDKKAVAAELVACGLLQKAAKGATCAGSPLAGLAQLDGVMKQLEPRVAAYTKDEAQLLATAMPALLAAVDEAALSASEAKKP